MPLIVPNSIPVVAVQDVFFIDRRGIAVADHIVIFCSQFGDAGAAEVILESRLFLNRHDLRLKIRLSAEMAGNPIGRLLLIISFTLDKVLIPPPNERQRAKKQNNRKKYVHGFENNDRKGSDSRMTDLRILLSKQNALEPELHGDEYLVRGRYIDTLLIDVELCKFYLAKQTKIDGIHNLRCEKGETLIF